MRGRALLPQTLVARLSAAATALALVPIWFFRYFPTVDGPSHLYNSFVLAHYFDPGSVVIRDYFIVNFRLFPNWTIYLLMSPLLRLMQPLIVQRIILSICVVSIPAAVVYLQKSFKGNTDAFSLLGVLVVYSDMLFMGFFNFIIAATLFAIALGFWWRRRNNRYLYGLYGLLILVYLSHALAYAAALLAIGLLAATERRWRTLLELIPAFALFAIDALARPKGELIYRGPRWLARQPLVFFGTGHILIAVAILLLIVTAILFTLTRSRANRAALVSAVLLILYCIAPWGYVSEGLEQAAYVNERLLFLIILTLPAWIVVPRVQIAMALLLFAIAVQLSVATVQIAKLSPYIDGIVRCSVLIRPHSTIQTFYAPSMTTQITPALHLNSYLALQTDVVDVDDYEARLRDFPLAYRANIVGRPSDYAVIWRGAPIRQVAGYKIIFDNGQMRLLQRYASPPP